MTGFGARGAVLTAEAWDDMSDVQRAADVLNEIFRCGSIIGFVANTAARASGDPYSKAFAATVTAVRVGALLGNSVSDFGVAGSGA